MTFLFSYVKGGTTLAACSADYEERAKKPGSLLPPLSDLKVARDYFTVGAGALTMAALATSGNAEPQRVASSSAESSADVRSADSSSRDIRLVHKSDGASSIPAVHSICT